MDIVVQARYSKLLELASKHAFQIRRTSFEYGMAFTDDAYEERFTKASIIATHECSNKALEDFRKEVTELFKDIPQFRLDLNANLKGIKLPVIDEVIPLVGLRSRRKPLVLRKGSYTLFYIWNSKSERSLEWMKRNSKILNNHLDWIGKLRVIELSTDEELEIASRELKSSLWEYLDHYWITKKGRTGFWSDMGKKIGPYYILVDRDGYIVAAGDPDWLQLEETLKRWMNGESVEEVYDDENDRKQFAGMEVRDPNTTFEEYKKLAENLVIAHKGDFQHILDPYFELKIQKVKVEGRPVELNGYFRVRYNWYLKYQSASEKIISSIERLFGNKVLIKQAQSKKELYTIQYGEKCNYCGKALGECEQYKCVSCPDVYFCVDCIKPRETAKTKAGIVHKHAFYFIQKDSKEVLDELKVVKVKVWDINELVREHKITCVICGKKKTNVVWKCANCVEQDYCNECFLVSRDPAHPKYNEICKAAKEAKHDMKTHVYIRDDFEGQLAYYF